jgi:hypothetical protein
MRPGMPERRSTTRFPTHLEGVIASKGTNMPIECIVWDLSESGVRLVLSEASDIPLEFELQIPSEGAKAMVRLIWTTGFHYGAAFTDC